MVNLCYQEHEKRDEGGEIVHWRLMKRITNVGEQEAETSPTPPIS